MCVLKLSNKLSLVKLSNYIYKFELFSIIMKFKWTYNSLKVLSEIKKKVIKNFENKTPENFKINLTKKKWFMIKIIPYDNPAFMLYVNDKFLKNYFYKNNEWIEKV